MRTWTATATAETQPAAILRVLTDPDAASAWAPVAFDVEDDDRPTAGRTARVYRLAPHESGSEVHTEIREAISKPKWARTGAAGRAHRAPASISARPTHGLAGRLLAEATSALLNAGALEQTLARIAAAA